MAIKTLFIPLAQAESVNQVQSTRDKYERYEEKTKKFDTRQLAQEEGDFVDAIANLNASISRYNEETNPNGGYTVISVTPVLGTEAEKVDKDEPMLGLVHTTGFMVMLYKAG